VAWNCRGAFHDRVCANAVGRRQHNVVGFIYVIDAQHRLGVASRGREQRTPAVINLGISIQHHNTDDHIRYPDNLLKKFSVVGSIRPYMLPKSTTFCQ
jgi:hypothetical protein